MMTVTVIVLMMMMLLQLLSIDGDDHSVNFNEWSVVLNTNASDISYKIDSGVQVNILPKKRILFFTNIGTSIII